MPTTKRVSPNYLFFFMCLSWVLDFRADASGQAVAYQGPMLAFYIVTFGSIWIKYLKNKTSAKIPGLFIFELFGIIFLLIGLAIGLLNKQQYYDVIRNTIGIVVYLTSCYITALICANDDLPKLNSLRRHLGWLSMIFLLVTPMGLYLSSGINFDTVRYQILGASLISVLGYSTAIIVSAGTKLEFLTLVFGIILLIISVTRTYVIGMALQILPSVQALLRKLSAFVGPIVTVLVLIIIVSAVFSVDQDSIMSRWTQRLFNQHVETGDDITYQTRVSEWQFMADAWLTDAKTIFFGNGLAAQTIYVIPPEAGGGTESDIGFGHGEHLSLLFIGGIFGGAPLLLMQFWQALSGFVFIVKQSRAVGNSSDVRFLGIWGAASIIGFFVAGFFSSSLYFRDWALWYGIGTGLYLGCRNRVEAL